MKKLTLFICFALVSVFTQAQWTSLSSGTTANLNSVYFTDAYTGYAVGGDNMMGSDGIILKTINGGATWNTVSSGMGVCLFSVFFTDANTGYAVGGDNYMESDGIVLKTIDGGATWDTILSGMGVCLISIFFTDANTGYAVGGNNMEYEGIILKTINGGTIWDTLSSGTEYNLTSVYFTNADTGYVLGRKFNFSSEVFDGIIIKTINGGTTWYTLSAAPTRALNSVYFTDANTGYAVGGQNRQDSEGIIFKTIDGGETWDTVLSGMGICLFSVFFTDANTGYAVGWGETQAHVFPAERVQIILKTTNGGLIWTRQSGGSIPIKNSVFFPNDTIGYIVGNEGTILKTTNGGGGVGYFFTSADLLYLAGDSASSAQLIIETDTTWTVSSLNDWSDFTPKNSKGLDTVTVFSKSANKTGISREGYITLEAADTAIFSKRIYVIQDFVTGLNDLKKASIFTIYPNPATHKINITTSGNLQGETQISIYSINGVKTGTHKFQNTNSFELDVSQLAKGIYLLQLQSADGIETQKLVVQ
jgi:photosystem II stability/assembly factor-like uncharacterized protein